MSAPFEILPNLWLFEDTCSVYVLRAGDRGVAIDFGAGGWLSDLPGLGIRRLEHVFLTHHHADQCAGLSARSDWPFTIHAPVGEDAFLTPENAEAHNRSWRSRGCPASYSVPPRGVEGIRYDVSGDSSLLWNGLVIRFIRTPGHGPNACSYLLDHGGRQIVFCGDAAHAGASIWQPYHLEWDHYTGTGALAAWEGITRLSGIAVDLLCPSHGPVVADRPRQTLRTLAKRLMRFYRAKGAVSPGEKDRYLVPEELPCGASRFLPHLIQFGMNGYLLLSSSGDSLVVDPFIPDMQSLGPLLAELGLARPSVSLVSHYHFDHSDGIPYLRERYGTKAWLHPWVAEALASTHLRIPWLPPEPIHADKLWPENGAWTWNEYEFRVAPWPGQTWWHCAFMTEVDGRRVLFGGDSFQPSSRWNGTGGFCAYNNSRFREGFVPSAQLALDWKPDIVAAGHGDCYRYSASKFRKVIKWAAFADQAVKDLCPSGDLDADYYLGQPTITADRRTA